MKNKSNRYRLVLEDIEEDKVIIVHLGTLVEIDLLTTTKFYDAYDIVSWFNASCLDKLPETHCYDAYITYNVNGKEKTLPVAYQDDLNIAIMAKRTINNEKRGVVVEDNCAVLGKTVQTYLALWKNGSHFRDFILNYINGYTKNMTFDYFAEGSIYSYEYKKLCDELSKYKNARTLAFGVEKYLARPKELTKATENTVEIVTKKQLLAALNSANISKITYILAVYAIDGEEHLTEQLFRNLSAEEFQKLDQSGFNSLLIQRNNQQDAQISNKII